MIQNNVAYVIFISRYILNDFLFMFIDNVPSVQNGRQGGGIKKRVHKTT